METLRAKRESAVKSVRVREAMDRKARAGQRNGGGRLWFGYVRVYANPDETITRKRVILREDLHPGTRPRCGRGRAGAAGRDGRLDHPRLDRARHQAGGSGGMVAFVAGRHADLAPASPGLREWQGQKYPTTDWPAIIDADTHEQLVKLFSDPARRKHITGRKLHLLSGLAPCPKCGHGLKYRKSAATATAPTPTPACGGRAGAAEGWRSRPNCWRST